MNSRYRFHPGTGLALLQGEGALSYEAWEGTALEILERAGASGTRRILSDRRTVRSAAKLTEGTRIRLRAFTDLTEALRWLLGVYEDEQITALIGWIDQED